MLFFSGFAAIIFSVAFWSFYQAEYWKGKYYDALGLNTRTGELEEETNHLLITKNGVMIDGHHRLKIMQELNKTS